MKFIKKLVGTPLFFIGAAMVWVAYLLMTTEDDTNSVSDAITTTLTIYKEIK